MSGVFPSSDANSIPRSSPRASSEATAARAETGTKEKVSPTGIAVLSFGSVRWTTVAASDAVIGASKSNVRPFPSKTPTMIPRFCAVARYPRIVSGISASLSKKVWSSPARGAIPAAFIAITTNSPLATGSFGSNRRLSPAIRPCMMDAATAISASPSRGEPTISSKTVSVARPFTVTETVAIPE